MARHSATIARMNFGDNYRRLGGANTDPIKAAVTSIDDAEWVNSSIRHQRFEKHTNAQTLSLVHDSDLRHTKPTRQPSLETFGSVIRPVLAITAEFFESSEEGAELTKKHGVGYFVRANLVRLKPGAAVDEQRDENYSLTHSHQVHVPIVADGKVIHRVGGESLRIPEGEIYEINNRRPYSVRNESEESAVLLVLDYVLKGEQCCCGRKLHPETPCAPETCKDTDLGNTPCGCFPAE